MLFFQALLASFLLAHVQARTLTALPEGVKVFHVATYSDNSTVYSNVDPSSDAACYELVDDNRKWRVKGYALYLKTKAVSKKTVKHVKGFKTAAIKFGRRLRSRLHTHPESPEVIELVDLQHEGEPATDQLYLNTTPDPIADHVAPDAGRPIAEAGHRANNAQPGQWPRRQIEFQVFNEQNPGHFGQYGTIITIHTNLAADDQEDEFDTFRGTDGSLTILCK